MTPISAPAILCLVAQRVPSTTSDPVSPAHSPVSALLSPPFAVYSRPATPARPRTCIDAGVAAIYISKLFVFTLTPREFLMHIGYNANEHKTRSLDRDGSETEGER
jgi:hypothetical protein